MISLLSWLKFGSGGRVFLVHFIFLVNLVGHFSNICFLVLEYKNSRKFITAWPKNNQLGKWTFSFINPYYCIWITVGLIPVKYRKEYAYFYLVTPYSLLCIFFTEIFIIQLNSIALDSVNLYNFYAFEKNSFQYRFTHYNRYELFR